MIKNKYCLSEEQLTHFYTVISKDYFAKFRKMTFILAIVACAAFIIIPFGFRGIFFGMMIALLIITACMPKMRNAKVKTDVNSMLDNYRKLYGDMPEQVVKIQNGIITVKVNGEQTSKFKMNEIITARQEEDIIVLEFQDNNVIPVFDTCYVEGTKEEFVELLKKYA